MRPNYTLFLGRFLGGPFEVFLAGFSGKSSSFFAGSFIFEFLRAVVNTVEQATSANNKEIGAKEAYEVFARVKNGKAHDATAHAAKNPSKTVGWVDGGTEARDDFEKTAKKSVGG